MIITLEEVKTLLQITNTDSDSLIIQLIPLVLTDVLEITNNYFLDTNIRYNSNTISFSSTVVSSTPIYTIQDSNSMFITEYLEKATDINITGSKYNDGNYSVDSVTSNSITLNSNYNTSLTTESSGNDVYITRVNYPKSIKLILANMIKYRMQKNLGDGIKSKKIDDYSVTYDSINKGGYPKSIISSLESKYSKINWN